MQFVAIAKHSVGKYKLERFFEKAGSSRLFLPGVREGMHYSRKTAGGKGFPRGKMVVLFGKVSPGILPSS